MAGSNSAGLPFATLSPAKPQTPDLWHRARERLAVLADRRASRLESANPAAARRWLGLASRLAPKFGPVHQRLCAWYTRANDRLGAVSVADAMVDRFNDSPDAWMLAGEANLGAYRLRDALIAFERVLQIEERPEAAMAAGTLYRREGDHATAGARFARAYAAGAGPDALRENAESLAAAGDPAAAQQARALWEKVTGKTWTK